MGVNFLGLVEQMIPHHPRLSESQRTLMAAAIRLDHPIAFKHRCSRRLSAAGWGISITDKGVMRVDESDSPWKEASSHLQELLAILKPDLHDLIDWTQPVEFNDNELQKVVRGATLGRLYLDRLVKVYTHTGGSQWILLHIEFQGDYGNIAAFNQRIYRYFSRLSDRYADRQITTLVILTHQKVAENLGCYHYKFMETELSFKYPVISLQQWANRKQELYAATSPFALFILAQLTAIETHNDPMLRAEEKFRLVRRLYERGLSREKILEFYRLIDWLLLLPESLERQFIDNLQHFEEEMVMPYISSAERIGREIGKEIGIREGVVKGEAQLLQKLIYFKFRQLPPWLEQQLNSASSAQIELWSQRLLTASTLDELRQAMAGSD
jgi:hypothetical protein